MVSAERIIRYGLTGLSSALPEEFKKNKKNRFFLVPFSACSSTFYWTVHHLWCSYPAGGPYNVVSGAVRPPCGSINADGLCPCRCFAIQEIFGLCPIFKVYRTRVLSVRECIMSKREIIDLILQLNTTAKPEFLAKFSVDDLDMYLDHLMEVDVEDMTLCV